MVGPVGLRDWFTGRDTSAAFAAVPLASERGGEAFAVDATSVDPAVFGLAGYVSPVGPVARVDRTSAMQVPAVKRIRDLVAGSLGQLPLGLVDPAGNPVAWSLFEQPEVGIPRTVTLTETFEDLLFEKFAWWLVTEYQWNGYPKYVRRIHPGQVTTDDRGNCWIEGERRDPGQVIRFVSPNDALLVAGARAIRTCQLLDAAAARHAEGIPPVDYFRPADDADPFPTDDAAKTFLASWRDSRQARSTGYVPAGLVYESGGWDPAKLQLAEQRQHAVLEIARVAGVDPEELGVSTTSRTYANQWDRRKAFLDFTLGGYRQAFEDRVSMTDVSPRGYLGRLDLDAFLRSDPKSRFEAYRLGLDVGVYAEGEPRQLEGRSPDAAANGRGGTPEQPTSTAATPPTEVNP